MAGDSWGAGTRREKEAEETFLTRLDVSHVDTGRLVEVWGRNFYMANAEMMKIG